MNTSPFDNRPDASRDDDEGDFNVPRGAGGGGRARGGSATGNGMSARLAARMKGAPRAQSGRAKVKASGGVSHAADPRQRVIVKAHFYRHAGGGGAALRAHGRYVEREGAERREEWGGDAPEGQAQADYLSRKGEHGFYDAQGDGVDGRARLATWAREDGRHFRVIVSPENGEAIGDLAGYTREVMALAAADLGRPLDWVAVNHWDTDNPHTHIVLRGRDGTGRPLSLPDSFIKHRFRDIARDVASERLGPRSPDDERRARDRDVRAHRVTGLDRRIAEELDPEGRARMAALGRGLGDPALAGAMKARLVELARLGLATEEKRGTFTMAPDWRTRLGALEAHVDIRRSRFAAVRAARTPGKGQTHSATERTTDAFQRAADALSRETGKPHRGLGERIQRWTVRGDVEIGGRGYVALERHDRVALAPRPDGLSVAAGQRVRAGIADGAAQISRVLGLDR